jgi:hypothetical protein
VDIPSSTILWAGQPVMSVSSKNTFPPRAGKTPLITLSSVDFPAPFVPIMEIIFLSSISKDACWTA